MNPMGSNIVWSNRSANTWSAIFRQSAPGVNNEINTCYGYLSVIMQLKIEQGSTYWKPGEHLGPSKTIHV